MMLYTLYIPIHCRFLSILTQQTREWYQTDRASTLCIVNKHMCLTQMHMIRHLNEEPSAIYVIILAYRQDRLCAH